MSTLELVSEKCWRTDCTRRPTWVIRNNDGDEVARSCAADAKAGLIQQKEKEEKRAGQVRT